MVSGLAALGLLATMGAVGVAALRRLGLGLDPMEHLAYGVSLGTVVASLALLALAFPFGLTTGLVLVVGAACSFVAGFLWADAAPSAVGVAPAWVRGRAWGWSGARGTIRAAWGRVSLLPTLVIGAFVLRWAFLWAGALTYEDDGLWAGQINIWGDWLVHLGDVSSFAYGDNIPPVHPRLGDSPIAYHFLASLTAAAMVKLGMDPASALTLHSFLFSALVALALYAFARRLTRDRPAAALTLALFLLGGGLGWILTAIEIDGSHRVLGTLLDHPWDQASRETVNFRWQNTYFAFIEPQRGYLYGLPLALLVLTLLHAAARRRGRRLFLIAGVIAGLLPLAHLSTLLALALVAPFLVLLAPARRWRPRFARWEIPLPDAGWALFGAAWVAIATPQLFWLQGGERGATAALRVHVGWVAAPDPWWWFWLKNLGWFVPLLALALLDRRLLPAPSRRLLWALMPIFVVANLVVFQPWDWDNHKILVYWFLGVCVLVATLLTRTWRDYSAPVVRCLLVGTVATMVLSGLLLNLQQALGKDRYRLLSTEEVELARQVRAMTPPDALFAIGLQYNHPIPMLSGRRVMMSYPGWLWTQGMDYADQERDLRAIYALDPAAADLLAKYGVDYIVVGPGEQTDLGADPAAFRARFPTLLRTPTYEVFAVDQT